MLSENPFRCFRESKVGAIDLNRPASIISQTDRRFGKRSLPMKIDVVRWFRASIRRLAAGSSVVLCLLLVGCQEETAARTDAEMNALIVGTWVLDDGPLSLYYMEKTYAPDGTSTGFLLNRQTSKRIDFTSRWEIKNGHFTGQILTSSDPALLPGATYSDQIVKMTKNRFVMIEEGTGRVTYKHRKHRFDLFN